MNMRKDFPNKKERSKLSWLLMCVVISIIVDFIWGLVETEVGDVKTQALVLVALLLGSFMLYQYWRKRK